MISARVASVARPGGPRALRHIFEGACNSADTSCILRDNVTIAVTPEIAAKLAAKKAEYAASKGKTMRRYTCLACRHNEYAASRPAACPKCSAVTHEDDLKKATAGMKDVVLVDDVAPSLLSRMVAHVKGPGVVMVEDRK